jgi:hypothetical protein
VSGSEAEYQRFLEALKPVIESNAELPACRADISLAYHNAVRGLEAILPHETRLREGHPALPLDEIKELPSLLLGLAYVSLHIGGASLPASETRALLAEARQLRGLLLKTADALAEAGIFSKDEVARVRKGHGPIDAADDCTALASMFRKKAAELRGKTAVTAKQVERAAVLGATLRTLLKPKSLSRRKKTSDGNVRTARERDAFWAEVMRRQERMWVAGACAFGWKVDEHIPALQSRVAPAKKTAKVKQPAPPPVGGAPVASPP